MPTQEINGYLTVVNPETGEEEQRETAVSVTMEDTLTTEARLEALEAAMLEMVLGGAENG